MKRTITTDTIMIILFTIIISIVLVGCTNKNLKDQKVIDIVAECNRGQQHYDVYISNLTFTNCRVYGNMCGSASGCTFTECTNLPIGEYVHSNTYIRRCVQ